MAEAEGDVPGEKELLADAARWRRHRRAGLVSWVDRKTKPKRKRGSNGTS